MYTPANENDERLNDLQKEAEENPNRLFIVIFDEAHYGVTSEKDDSTSTKKLPYEKLVSILSRTECTHTRARVLYTHFLKNFIKLLRVSPSNPFDWKFLKMA